jgi:transposase
MKLGASKEFRCPPCKVVLGRDSNGARNIPLQYLALSKKALVSFLGIDRKSQFNSERV